MRKRVTPSTVWCHCFRKSPFSQSTRKQKTGVFESLHFGDKSVLEWLRFWWPKTSFTCRWEAKTQRKVYVFIRIKFASLASCVDAPVGERGLPQIRLGNGFVLMQAPKKLLLPGLILSTSAFELYFSSLNSGWWLWAITQLNCIRFFFLMNLINSLEPSRRFATLVSKWKTRMVSLRRHSIFRMNNHFWQHIL